MDYPPAFRRERGKIANVAMMVGRIAANFFNMIIRGKREADLILVANRRTREALPWGTKGSVHELVENGVDLTIWQRKSLEKSHLGLRLIYVGRLIDWKALDIVLEAMHRLKAEIKVSFEIIGDGPMRQPWQELTSRLGLGRIVEFSGFLPQPECAQRLRQADVFVLPSLFECGGAVVLEAMATGLPVIAAAWGGPLDYLDETCGIPVEPQSREALISGFADGIRALAKSNSLRARMGEAGHQRARQQFDWDRKIDRMLGFYADVSKKPLQH
jgi:glycosyltransferase involved in cell wall biosynthesis